MDNKQYWDKVYENVDIICSQTPILEETCPVIKHEVEVANVTNETIPTINPSNPITVDDMAWLIRMSNYSIAVVYHMIIYWMLNMRRYKNDNLLDVKYEKIQE